ncbi:hypothetical protein ODJ79_23905 [Actinoplanes sp. KI2]|uniref:hypothetical protein n=1 Tax=Actinoplanes sp. KI2 TaxID=2983315 RepID=UPI0021D58DAF|nr:hypothetical protein [Actinoplanes sp. KI2]MCU7726786.1 hypothetical protein [Actinoplanes sp. KI2]
MTSLEPETPPFIDGDIPVTEVISVAPGAPVFVDTTGRRSRLLRRLAYGFGALVMLYGGLISVSLVGGPVPSSAVLPLPGLEPAGDTGEKRPAPPSPAPAPTPSLSPKPVLVVDALPPRGNTSAPGLEAAKVTSATARPVTKPTATKKPAPTVPPKPVPSASRPVESTTAPTTPATTTPTTTPTSPTSPPTGGQGGGEGTPIASAKAAAAAPTSDLPEARPAEVEA